VVSPIISYGIYFGLLAWSIWYGNQRRKAGERLAAANASNITAERRRKDATLSLQATPNIQLKT
jgi:hypothetical protein